MGCEFSEGVKRGNRNFSRVTIVVFLSSTGKAAFLLLSGEDRCPQPGRLRIRFGLMRLGGAQLGELRGRV